MLKKLKPYIISILIALGVGGLSAFLTRNNMNIYESINKPPLAPPSVLFPIVWTILFILMGISSAAVYSSRNSPYKESALNIYTLQLIINFLWSIIFFNMQNYLLAFILLIFLWLFIYNMIKFFLKVNPIAGILQIPYLLWVTFAGYLHFMIYILNR